EVHRRSDHQRTRTISRRRHWHRRHGMPISGAREAMPWATVTLFPPYSLDTSILAAVLVGVLVLAALTETLGWVFVGLVVPGYLASVFVVHPETGLTVVVEALVTYGFAVLLSSVCRRTGVWSEFFGRDRFFAV